MPAGDAGGRCWDWGHSLCCQESTPFPPTAPGRCRAPSSPGSFSSHAHLLPGVKRAAQLCGGLEITAQSFKKCRRLREYRGARFVLLIPRTFCTTACRARPPPTSIRTRGPLLAVPARHCCILASSRPCCDAALGRAQLRCLQQEWQQECRCCSRPFPGMGGDQKKSTYCSSQTRHTVLRPPGAMTLLVL